MNNLQLKREVFIWKTEVYITTKQNQEFEKMVFKCI